MTILEAIEDPKIFGQWLQGFNMAAWFVFHKSVFGLPLDGEWEIETYKRCTQREALPIKRAVEVYAPIGRRGGKSANVALLAVFMSAIDTSWQRHLAPGQKAVFAIVSVDRLAARQVYDYCSGILHSSPMLKRLIESEGKEEIELKTGAVIQIRTASFRSVRGPAYIGACLDELAYFRDAETSANPASEIISAIRPAIIEGGIIIGVSSVYNRSGIFYDEYSENFARDSETLIWQAPTLTMNPTFSAKKIEREKGKDLAVAMAEYFSEWRSDLATLFSAELIDASIVPGRGDFPASKGLSYVAGVDMSGGRRDSSALSICHRQNNGRVTVDFLREVKAPHSPAEVVKEFSAILLAYGCHTVTGDRYGGEWPRDAFQKHGISYKISEQTASEAYLSLLPMFSNRSVELPDDQRLRSQFLSLMRKTSSGGRDSVIVSAGVTVAHADLANAVALALVSFQQAVMGSFVGSADGSGFLCSEVPSGGLERAITGADFDD